MIVEESETCPECGGHNIEVEPAWKDNECIGSRFLCRNCGWCEDYFEDGPEEASEHQRQLRKKWVLVESLPDDLESRVKDLAEKTDGGDSE